LKHPILTAPASLAGQRLDRRGSDWLPDLRLQRLDVFGGSTPGAAGSALEPPPNGDEVSEIEAMHDRKCGARLQRRGASAAQLGVIGPAWNSFELAGGVAWELAACIKELLRPQKDLKGSARSVQRSRD
jgi:hypothetical protein